MHTARLLQTSHFPGSPRRAAPRFSLVEMLAVMIVMTILLTLGMGMFYALAKTSGIDGAARMVSSQLYLCRSYAVSKRANIAFLIYDTDQELAIRPCVLNSDGSYNAFVANSKWEYLPAAAQVTAGNVDSVTAPVPNSGGSPTVAMNAIAFKPSGSLRSAAVTPTIVVSGPGGSQPLTITVDWLTGKARFTD